MNMYNQHFFCYTYAYRKKHRFLVDKFRARKLHRLTYSIV